MKNDDLWQLDAEPGPALPISDDALGRLVGGAMDRAYGAPVEDAGPVEPKTGNAHGRRYVAGIGLAACVAIVAGVFLHSSGTEPPPSAPTRATTMPIPAVNEPATPPDPITAPGAAPGVLTVDVRALPSVGTPSSGSPRATAGSAEAPRDLLREANRLRAERRWGDAAALYRRVAEARSGESPTAMLALASIRLEHQNDAREAKRLYRAVLDAEPGGPLAEEARWGVAMACRALGDAREESAALQAFLAHHSTSLSAPKARKRLAELDANRDGRGEVAP